MLKQNSDNEFYDTSNVAPFPGNVNKSPDDTMGRFKKGGFSHKKYKSQYEKVSDAQKKRWNVPQEDHSYSTQQNRASKFESLERTCGGGVTE